VTAPQWGAFQKVWSDLSADRIDLSPWIS